MIANNYGSTEIYTAIDDYHCIIFPRNNRGIIEAIIEDFSFNGTFINNEIIGQNQSRVLQDNDEITLSDMSRFKFRYGVIRKGNSLRQSYRIVKKIGMGHFASVYLCNEKKTGHIFAAKRFAGNSMSVRTNGLIEELAIVMSVSHPGIVRPRDIFDEDDGLYFILEHAQKGELFNYIVDNQKLSEDETRHIYGQLGSAIQYLHGRGIVHRDVKPENILLFDSDQQYPTVKITDFGLSKIIEETDFTTTLCGTPSYVAPEILASQSQRKYTHAVDIWSMGVVLYICLCGFPPFSDELNTPENPYSLSQQIRSARFDYPSPYWDSVGDPALDLIDCMLTVDVEKRFKIRDVMTHPWMTAAPASKPEENNSEQLSISTA